MSRVELCRDPLRAVLNLGVLLFTLPGAVWAHDVISIEEQWELQVGGPETVRSAPQVTMTMSPRADLACDFFIFSLNHRSYPSYAPGGMEVQRWHGKDAIESRESPHESMLCVDGETVCWTQRMTLDAGILVFEISDGSSQTWGGFGDQGYLKITTQTSLANLSGYQPAISINESGIQYAGNRVSSLVLQKLIWKTADGQVHELTAPIDIDTDIDP